MKSGHYIPECMDEKMADSVTLLTLAAWSWLSILSLVSWIFCADYARYASVSVACTAMRYLN